MTDEKVKLTPENMKIYIEHCNMVDEYIEMQIEMMLEAKHNGD